MRSKVPARAILVCLFFTFRAAGADVPGAMYRLDIPAQDLNAALQQLALASRHNLFYRSELVAGRVSPALKGEFTTDEALDALLNGTDFTYDITPLATVLIRDKDSSLIASAAANAPLRVAAVVGAEERAKTDPPATQGEPAPLEEVLVTAQKREERLQDVPIAIAVLGGNAFDKSSDRGIVEAVGRVPGVFSAVSGNGSRQGGGNPMIVIRGVSAPATGTSTTGYYLDNVPYSRNTLSIVPDINPYDLDRVEVLRGPQGTLYGATALNGVVRVLTKNPDLQDFEFKTRGSLQSTERGSESYSGDTAFNMPLIQDKLAARLVLGYQDLGGWIDKPNLASGPKKDANDTEKKTGRIKLAAKPTDDFWVGLSGWFQRSEGGSLPTSSDGGRTNVSRLDEYNTFDFDIYNLDLGYDTRLFSIKSATSYVDLTLDNSFDFTSQVPGNAIIGTADSSIFTEEVVLNSLGQGPWRWTLGAMYRDGQDNVSQLRSLSTVPDITHTQSKSIAVYGELTRVFAEGRYELTGGLRYFRDKLHDWEDSRSDTPNGIPTGGLQSTESTFKKTTPRVVFTWHPEEGSTLYASYSQGFRSGINQRFAVVAADPNVPAAQPDTLTNYEIGAKENLLGGQLALELALYYIDWKDPQLNRTIYIGNPLGPSVIYDSGDSISGAGFDLSIAYSPIDSLKLGLNGGWNDLTFDTDVYSLTNVRGVGVLNILVSRKGTRPVSSPQTTVGAFVDYSVPLGGNGYRGRLSASANHVSEQISAIDSSGRVNRSEGVPYKGDSMMITRASFTVDAPKHWSAMLFVDNIGNDQGLMRDSFSSQYNTVIRPRTYGVQLEYRY